MRYRLITVALLSFGAACLAPVATAASRPQAPGNGVCQWGGTPAAPTGTVTFSRGLTNNPSPYPISFVATGPAQGAPCASTVTYKGELVAGSSCLVQQFEGTVEGVPGVTRFYGPGVTPNVAEVLWNGAGKVVGADTPTVANQNLLQQVLADPTICQSPGGYTRGKFSSIISLFANSGT